MDQRLVIEHCLYGASARLAESSPGNLSRRLAGVYHPDALWREPHPLNKMQGINAIADCVWQPLPQAIPDLERSDVIVAAGKPAYIRYAEDHSILDGKVSRSTILTDRLHLMRQAGVRPVTACLGCEGRWPGPHTADGVLLTPQSKSVSAESLTQTICLHSSLGNGTYSVTGGWPSVYAKYIAGTFMGMAPAAGRDVEMCVMDFNLHHKCLIRENWMPLDIIHLLRQIDIDVFGRLQSLTATNTRRVGGEPERTACRPEDAALRV